MRLLVPIALFAALAAWAQAPRLMEVQEQRLANGARLLVVERKGLTAFHATLVFRGGRAEEPAPLAGATDLLAKCLFGTTWPEDLDPARNPGLEALLKQQEGLLESLRLENLRLRRNPAAESQAPALEASLAALQERLKGHFSSAPLSDLYLARGGRQGAEATADALVAWTELPQDALDLWCRTEGQRLRALQLSRFSLARTAFVAGLRASGSQGPAMLRGAALPGHPYGRDLLDYLPSLEAMRWTDLRTHARRALSPDRMTIILVGGQGMDTVLPLVARHLGTLPASTGQEEAILPEIPADLGDRRVQATLGGTPRLLVGWRIPPRTDPAHLALRMAAQLLAGGKASRLPERLVLQKLVAQDAALRMDDPGGRLPGLMVADLRPAPGHGLPELERALHSEILRLQQEPISQEEWLRALAQLEADLLRKVDEPASLASALGRAWVEGGDWRLAETELQRLRTLGPEVVQAAARVWLSPSHRTSVWLEAAPEEGQDPVEAETARVLKALAATRIQDLAQREQMVTEGLRQIRMLSPEDRLRTLKLLQAQLPSGKP